MAVVLAEGVVKKVCEMAVQPALNEVSIVWNFMEDFELLKYRIEEINCVLNEANEESTGQKESMKKWLHRVRDIAWEAEDILEECAVDSMYATNTRFWALSFNQLIIRHQMGRRIQNAKARLSTVVQDGSQLNIVRAAVAHKEEEAAESSSGQGFRRSSILPADSKPVAIQSKIESMVILLENPQIPIIAVVGMGGMGKTHLLRNLYEAKKGRYEISAWLSVSQFYSVSQLQRDLASHLGINISAQIREGGVSEQRAAELIYSFLQGKRYLIVLDDVWRAARESDLIARLGLPTRDNRESKILVSTRSRETRRVGVCFVLMRFLDVRGEIGQQCQSTCGNLPLAIKTTAASLTSTTQPRKWQSKLNKLKNVSTSNDPVMDILKLSYYSLPEHLKACFAYLSFFPEDEQIECEYLTYLWMGEGFIPAGENPWDCLDQLANLCLLEVWENEERWVLKKYCKIHDLLLDLAILVSRENKCAFSFEEAFSKLQYVNTGGGRWCRLFLAKKDINEHAISKRHPVSPTLVRTLSLSCNDQIGRKIPAMLFSGMRVLRVLDLSHTSISTLPASVGEMKLLKVLNLRQTYIKKVPKCVRHLKSLSFLDVSHCFLFQQSQAPKWISELKCLQHLEGPFKRMPKAISKLESLRTLRTSHLSLSTKEDGVLRLEDVGKMREIEEIAVCVSDESQLERMEEGILAPLLKMRRLSFRNAFSESESDLPQFPERMSAMRDLEHLTLDRFAVPRWLCYLSNLRCLYLWSCHCSNYLELQALPNLVSLFLNGNKSCKELPKAFGKSGGFPHLRSFELREFPELEEFPEMEDGAMACLEQLELSFCSKLNKVGEGLERLKRLKKFNISDCGTNKFRETLKEGGIYWKKIKSTNLQIEIICR